MTDKQRLEELIQIALSNGVTYLKFGDIEFSIDLPKTIPIEDLTPKTQELSNEDMLFYSVEAPPESK